MTRHAVVTITLLLTVALSPAAPHASGRLPSQAASPETTQARVLATSKTSTLEKELNEAAERADPNLVVRRIGKRVH